MIAKDISQSDDQHDHLRLKQGRCRILRGLDDEEEGAADCRDHETGTGDRHEDARKRIQGHAVPGAHQPQIERGDAAEQQSDADDVSGIHQGIDPFRTAEAAGKRRAFETGQEIHQHAVESGPMGL